MKNVKSQEDVDSEGKLATFEKPYTNREGQSDSQADEVPFTVRYRQKSNAVFDDVSSLIYLAKEKGRA